MVMETASVCPICKKRLAARYVRRGDNVYIEKECPQHGAFSTVVWRGAESFERWAPEPTRDGENPDCPRDCGLCASHLRGTCCAILEVTTRCNLHCPFCFAGDADGSQPDTVELKRRLRDMHAKGLRFIHLSGGEPTVREDLPELVRYAAELGFEYIQLNTNGIRLAQESGYAQALTDAGLSAVFLQFDGTTDEIYSALRGAPLLKTKLTAVERCAAAGVGVVFVPTVVPRINEGNIGAIVKLAASLAPAVKGVHLQPVTYTGRYPQPPADDSRITLPELLSALETQTEGFVKAAHFAPSCCDHPLCGFHAEYMLDGGKAKAVFGNRNGKLTAVGAEEAVRKSQSYVSLRWTRPKDGGCCCGGDTTTMDGYLQYIREHSFSISAMAFQDAYNLDLGRARQCSVQIYAANGELVPVCVFNVMRRH